MLKSIKDYWKMYLLEREIKKQLKSCTSKERSHVLLNRWVKIEKIWLKRNWIM